MLTRVVRDDRGTEVPLRYTQRGHSALLAAHAEEARQQAAKRISARASELVDAGPQRSLLERAGVLFLKSMFAIAVAVAFAAGLLAFMGVLLTIVLGPIVLFATAGSIPAPVRVGVIAFLLVVLVPFAVVRHRRRWPSRRAKELTQRRMCGACGYSLLRLVEASDGCTVCPECGAAWKLGKEGMVECVACGHSIVGTAVSEDGHVFCPECELRYDLTASDEQ